MAREFILPKIEGRATAHILDTSHLEQVLALQEETRAALPEAQKRFLLPRPAEYYQDFLSGKDGNMIGMLYQDRLIGQLVIMGPVSLEQATKTQAITRNDVTFHHAGTKENITVIKSVAVHPEWRGNDIAPNLLGIALDQTKACAAHHAFAHISAENIRSWEMFLQLGFGIVAAGIDPVDKQPRFVLQRPAAGFGTHHAASVKDLDPLTDFAAIMRLTNFEALIGQIDTSTLSLRLAFQSNIDNASVGSDSVASSREKV